MVQLDRFPVVIFVAEIYCLPNDQTNGTQFSNRRSGCPLLEGGAF